MNTIPNKVPQGLKKTAAMMILQHEDSFLLLQRKNPPNQGMYVPVGGKLDPFEAPYQAAVRETFEETGIRVEKPVFGGVLVESSPTRYNWQSYIYLAKIDYLPPPPCDEGILSWVKLPEVLDLPTPPTDWMVYKYMMAGKPFVFSAKYNTELQMLEMWEEIEGIRVI